MRTLRSNGKFLFRDTILFRVPLPTALSLSLSIQYIISISSLVAAAAAAAAPKESSKTSKQHPKNYRHSRELAEEWIKKTHSLPLRLPLAGRARTMTTTDRPRSTDDESEMRFVNQFVSFGQRRVSDEYGQRLGGLEWTDFEAPKLCVS